mmetsp:Transcript_10560/g.13705  ORF Transcript_10560/g.13705 Transcript_10560/m.13705 type:complete len:288 (-) Transcript_10560:301-1164(-)|eukprot:CAMPEP_0117747420 /NCGR_PEP_ID=MMETSP0947-20121206/8494_1 /TAXON_ID=44440 /ORGANISM="Chattonella subsalsa, Strain CCMP2191" /LENGTH=287 /DNA_ID=CAMNT_0005564857 /DNA_START=76 /DNA_END=939 /DNA_ORIENTATION=+
MAPKQKASKKSEQKRQKQVIEDKTFGLKNKKKSKQVQKFVQQVEKQVKAGGPNQGRKPTVDKRSQKKAKAAAQAELNALLAQGLQTNPKKAAGKKNKGEEELVPVAVQNRKKQEQETIYLEDEPKTLEDLIEEQREKWRQAGVSGTPVTHESLMKWKADKAEKRRREARRKVEAEQKKKGGGKGLSVISGRDLFHYKQELFVDDEDALADEVTERVREDEDEEKADDPNLESKDEEKKAEEQPPLEVTEIVLEDEGTQVAVAVQEQLYLDGDDEDLDDIVDSDEEGT